MKRLDPRDEKRLAWIVDFTARYGYPPTVRQIQEHEGWKSVESAHSFLSRMRREKRVEWEDGQVRTLRVVEAE